MDRFLRAVRRASVGLLLASAVTGCGFGGSDNAAPVIDRDALQGAWTTPGGETTDDAAGLLLEVQQGPEHCEWERALIMTLAVPLGEPAATSASTRRYARDLEDVLPSGAVREAFVENSTVPEDAEATGFRTNGVELWVAPSTFDRYIYLRSEGRFEAWPRLEDTALCA